MGLPMICGSAQAYARNLYTQTKAMLRVENELTPTEQKQQRDKNMIEAMLDPDRGKSISLNSVKAKLERGKKLSPKEMEWLRRNEPALYKKAEEVQREREQFERELKSCKTKDDVKRLRLRYSRKICNEMSVAMKNGGDITTPKWKILAIDDSHGEFVRTREYKEMPTDVELQAGKQKTRKKKETKKKAVKERALLPQTEETCKKFSSGRTPDEKKAAGDSPQPDAADVGTGAQTKSFTAQVVTHGADRAFYAFGASAPASASSTQQGTFSVSTGQAGPVGFAGRA